MVDILGMGLGSFGLVEDSLNNFREKLADMLAALRWEGMAASLRIPAHHCLPQDIGSKVADTLRCGLWFRPLFLHLGMQSLTMHLA
jgi:hypothetical protein